MEARIDTVCDVTRQNFILTSLYSQVSFSCLECITTRALFTAGIRARRIAPIPIVVPEIDDIKAIGKFSDRHRPLPILLNPFSSFQRRGIGEMPVDFASKLHHDIYPSIDPKTTLRNVTEGKVIVLTVAGKGIGEVRGDRRDLV